MNTDLIVDELAAYAFRKHADDDDDFSGDAATQNKANHSQKLRLALIGLGALGAGGLAAWGLSGDMGKQLGQWVGGTPEKTPMGKALSSSLTHGIAAGAGAAALRSGTAGHLADSTTPAGESTGGKLYESSPGVMERAATTASNAGLLPRSTPNQIAKDVTALTAEKAEPGNFVQRHLTPMFTSPEAKTTFEGFKTYGDLATQNAESTAPAKETAKQTLQAPKAVDADAPITLGLQRPIDAKNVVTAMKQFQSANPTPMKANAAGLYIQGADGLTPVSASNLNADELLNPNTKLYTSVLTPKGYVIAPLGNAAPDLANQINVAKNMTVRSADMTPERETELFMLKQTTAPKVTEYLKQLEPLTKTDPRAKVVYDALLGDLVNTHQVGTHAETGYTPRTDTTPSSARTLSLIAERVRARAGGFQSLQSAMHENRYQAGAKPALGRALRTGAVVGGLSWALKQALGMTSGTYLGE